MPGWIGDRWEAVAVDTDADQLQRAVAMRNGAVVGDPPSRAFAGTSGAETASVSMMDGRLAAQIDLIRRAQAGDRDAFGELARQQLGRMYATAFLVLRASEPARDATQDALVDAWRGIHGLRNPHRFGPWLHRLLLRRCARNLRRADRDIDLDAAAGQLVNDETGHVADRDQLARGFRRLSADQRMILVLRYYFDQSIERVADTLDLPPGTVKSRTSRALMALRNALADDDRRPSRSTREAQS